MFQTMFQVEQKNRTTMKELNELSRFMAVEITPHWFAGETVNQPERGEKYINPNNKRDFPAIFERNYQEHIKTEPDTTPRDYQQYAKEYLSYLMGKIESRYKAPEKIGNYRWAKRFYNEYLINGLGFDTVLTPRQLKYIYPEMQQYCATSQKHFIAALTPRPLPPGFERVRWIDLNRNKQSNQYSLRAFLEVVTGGKTIRKADVSRCFTQPDGQPITLGKPKKDAYYQRNIKKFGKLM